MSEDEKRGPNVFQGSLYRENFFGANEGSVGKRSPIKRNDDPRNLMLDRFPNLGEDKKKGLVGEKGDNKDIHEQDTDREGERFNKKTVGFKVLEGLSEGAFPDVSQSDVATDWDP